MPVKVLIQIQKLNPYVSLLFGGISAFGKKKVLLRTAVMCLHALPINALQWSLFEGIGIFLVEYPKLIFSIVFPKQCSI